MIGLISIQSIDRLTPLSIHPSIHCTPSAPTHPCGHPPPDRFAAYGEAEAFFVSTGVNALYILYGGLILYPRMLLTDKVTPEMTRLPKVRLCVRHADGMKCVGIRRTKVFCILRLPSPPLSLSYILKHVPCVHRRASSSWASWTAAARSLQPWAPFTRQVRPTAGPDRLHAYIR